MTVTEEVILVTSVLYIAVGLAVVSHDLVEYIFRVLVIIFIVDEVLAELSVSSPVEVCHLIVVIPVH